MNFNKTNSKLSDIEEEMQISPILSEIEDVISDMKEGGARKEEGCAPPSPTPSLATLPEVSDIDEADPSSRQVRSPPSPTPSLTSLPEISDIEEHAPRVSFLELAKGSDLEDEDYLPSLQLSDIEEDEENGRLDKKAFKKLNSALENTPSQFPFDELETDDSDLSEDELEERIQRIPPPKLPDPEELAEAMSVLDPNQRNLQVVCALLRANGQTMESLGFIGPSRNVESVPIEVFRKANKMDMIQSATAHEQSTWDELYSRQLRIGDELFSNHLKGRLDFGGSRATAYNRKARKIGMFQPVVCIQCKLKFISASCNGDKPCALRAI